MIPITGVYIELRSGSPDRLAAFYERLGGLQRDPGPGVVLRGPGLTLSIKPSLDDAAEDGSTIFGFRVPDGEDPSALRAAAVAAGAVLLSESKREGLATLSCQDPDGNPFVIVAALPSVGVETAPAIITPSPSVVSPAASAPPVAAPASGPPSTVPTASVPAPASNRPTRREYDRLRDMDRLASMAESIAGLDMAFTEDDPAHVMDRMRSKIPFVSEAEMRAREADAEMRAREKQTAVDDMLSQYRAQVTGSPAAPPPASPETQIPAPAVLPIPETAQPDEPDPVLEDLSTPHTLGPSAGVSTDEPDPIQADAPRTLGRSRAYDGDDELPSS